MFSSLAVILNIFTNKFVGRHYESRQLFGDLSRPRIDVNHKEYIVLVGNYHLMVVSH